MLLDMFEIATGTTPGTKNRGGLPQRNQDDVLGHATPELITLAAADGSSGSPRSYLAAAHQVDWITQLTHEHAASGKPFDEDVWAYIAGEIARRIETNARWSHLPLRKAIQRSWAATVGEIVVGPELTDFAFFGDGRFYLNGKLIIVKAALELDEGPAPAYPCYLVVKSKIPIKDLVFQVLTFPTAQIQNAAIMTDGLDHYLAAVGKKVPGFDDLIPPPSHFWTDDRLFSDPDGISQDLNYFTWDWERPNGRLIAGRLFDDMAVGSIRRKKLTTEA